MTEPNIDLPDVCDCTPMPSRYWMLPSGSWIHVGELTDSSDPVADAGRYLELGCTEWMIRRPACGRVYGHSLTSPGPP